MWQDLFSVEIPLWEKILRTVAVYLLVTLIFRVVGKRTIAAMSTMDFVLLFLLSNVVQNAIIGADNSLLGGTIGALTLVSVNALFDRIALISPASRRWLVGTPTMVVTDGKLDRTALGRIGMTDAQFEILVHQQDGNSVSDIETASMEPEGHLVVRLKKSAQSASRSDISAVNARLDRIEALLSRR